MKRIIFLVSVLLPFTLQSQSDTTIGNLETFARLYGYVRYFHPSDEASEVDWERLAIYGSKRVEKCSNPTELAAALNEIFKPIAPLIQIGEDVPNALDSLSITPPSLDDTLTVTWQHYGLGMKRKNYVYKSIRLNRPVEYISSSDFGSASTKLSLMKYRGLPFSFSAKCRSVEESGSMHLWVRLEDKERNTVFFDNMMDRPVTDTSISKYEINGVINDAVDSAYFGSFLYKSGMGEVDEMVFQVYVDDKWHVLFKEDFEDDKVDEAPAQLNSGIGKNSSGIEGYEIKVTESFAPGNRAMRIEKLEDEIEFGDIATPLFPQHAKVGESIRKDIGSGLYCLVPLALYGDSEHTYPIPEPGAFEALNDKLAGIPSSDITGNNIYVRWAGIIITWNVFEHFFPYFDLLEVDWNNSLSQALSRTYHDHDEYDFLRTLRKLTASLKDGHIYISNRRLFPKESHLLPVAWEWVEGRLVITEVLDDSPLRVGDVIRKIDGKDSQKFFEDFAQYVSAGTKGRLEYRVASASLHGTKGSSVELLVEHADGTVEPVKLERNLSWNEYNNLLTLKEASKQISEDIYYLNIDQISMEEIKSLLPELKKVQAVICDLRGYPNSNDEFIQHLLTVKDTSSQWMKVPRIIYPHRENMIGFGAHSWGLEPLKPHIDAEIIFIIDGSAISYSESYMGFIDHYDLATIVGQPTAGTNGNVNILNLPGEYSIRWTGMRVEKHDGSQHYAVGITPDVWINRTIEGIRSGEDEFLSKAIEIARSKIEIEE